MTRKVYEIDTTEGKRYSIGVFDNGELLKGSSPKYYKTKSRADKELKKLLEDY